MKKYSTLLFLLGGMVSSLTAQVVTTEPAEFSAVEPVTITIDVSGTPVEGVDPVFIWAWVPDCCDSPTNGEWTNSNPANQMTRVSDNVWSFTITSLRDFYQQTPGAIGDQMGFLAKAKDGTGDIKTADQFLVVEPPRFVESDFRTFPANFSQEDIVTVFYNQTLDQNEATQNLSEVYLYMQAETEAGNTLVPIAPEEIGNSAQAQLQSVGNGQFRLTFIPSEYFDVAERDRITQITFRVRSKDDHEVNLGDRIRFPFELK